VTATVQKTAHPLHAAGRSFGRTVAAFGVVAIMSVILWYTAVRLLAIEHVGIIAAVYTTTVGLFVVSRFVLAAFYRSPADMGIEPTVAIIIPAFNEGVSVLRTINACIDQDYPDEKLQIVCVNDGSTDDTWSYIQHAVNRFGDRVMAIDLGSNQGKRAAMAEGVRRTDSEILVFIDSDSEPVPGGLRRIVQPFARADVGAVAGLTHARNADVNALTRMQATRYFISFQLLKAAESVLGAVSCCSGCFSAYRRSAVEPLLNSWEHQRFLGAACTYGDDRALTNMVIKDGSRSEYHAGAVALTDVPVAYQGFFRQQLRWKKSWLRESPILLAHIWRSRPLAFPVVLLSTLAGLLSPFVLLASLILVPIMFGVVPIVYLVGLLLVAFAYGLFHRALSDDGGWIWAVIGTIFYISFSAQMFWALARIRDGRWGTRAA
jgi:hyaluronan synthase